MNKTVEKIDMSNVKIWSKKKRYFIPFEKPQALVLFMENYNKCKNCGFYKSACMCKDRKQKKGLNLNSIKNAFKPWINKKRIVYHSRKCSKLMKKSNSLEEKAFRHNNIVRNLQESKRNWKK